MVEGEWRRRAETDEKSYQKNQLREFFNGDRIFFDFFFFNGGEEHVETHEGKRGPREKADDREPDEEVAEEALDGAGGVDGDGAFGSVEEAGEEAG
ncbi:hypothetical protein Syun_021034 [Stephania yunnanensis]|uniref:Uncharacterized protein n=1 Tax=Stephania yunnanensis TaxID=152371 RepID=A0AAP0IFB5_9MAGN